MVRKLTVVLLTGVMCLVGITSALAVTYNEAPMLRVKVAAGELPPVEERLPDEPKIKKVAEEIGQYGGTLHTFGGDLLWSTLSYMMTLDGEIVPGLAKGYELSDDAKSLTLYLRKGAKWSDGYPFTADDILFQFEDMHWMDEVESWNEFPEVLRVKKIDDYTVRFEMDKPFPGMPVKMSGWLGCEIYIFSPKHYLKKWHIRYNPKADELAKEEGFDNWWEAFNYHGWYFSKDTNVPTMEPWIPKEFTATTVVFERNPYFYQVDEEGNQLPYIDRLVITQVDSEGYQMKIISGEADFAFGGTSILNYPLYKEHEEEGGYRVIPVAGINSSEIAFGLNQNHPDPFLGEVFRDVRFRQALSLAINREEINNTVYLGLGVPCQATALPATTFYKEEWGKAYAQYNPDRANHLLNEVGLSEQDKDGFRINPDGQPILLVVEYLTGNTAVETQLELVKEYWEDIGLKVMLKGLGAGGLGTGGIFDLRSQALDHIIIVHPYQDAAEISTYLGGCRARPDGLKECPAWAEWLRANHDVSIGKRKLEDFEDGKLPGEEPPEEIKQQWQRVYQGVMQTRFGSKEYIQICQEIYDFQAKNLYAIGTVGMVPQIFIVKKDLRNFPETEAVKPTYGKVRDLPFEEAQQFFWKQ